jgi:hypothetical protein
MFYSSCKKKEETKTNSYRSAQDNATAQSTFSRSYTQISKASLKVGSKSTNDTIFGCPVLYISGTWPNKTLILDFGTGCTDSTDGITRSGKIISHITGLYVDSNSVVTSTFDNFYETINGVAHQIQGTQVITNLGHNAAHHPHFSNVVTGASISYAEGTIQWSSQLENEWTAGYNTYLNPFDDEYKVTGSSSGTDISGAPFSVTITNPLLTKFCTTLWSWIIASGTLDVVNPGYPTITVDYGTGTCDWTVYITINGTTYTWSYI